MGNKNLARRTKNWNKAEHKDWYKGWNKDRVDNGTLSRIKDWGMVGNKD